MKRNGFIIAGICIGLLGSVFTLYVIKKVSYDEFVVKHPFHPSQKGTFSSDKKPDSPDLAWEQNYLMTMDPALGRPTPEKLSVARKQIAEFFTKKQASRTGTNQYPWIERGPDNVGGRTRAILWDPNDVDGTKVWAGGVSGGLWYNEDVFNANSSWQKVDDFWENIGITAIATDPTDPTIFYVGTGESNGQATKGKGVFKTTDGGDTWSHLAATEDFAFINDLIVRNENGTGVLYVAVAPTYYNKDYHGVQSLGLQRSTNGGTSFTQVLPDIVSSTVPEAISDLDIDANNNLWAGTVKNVYGLGGGSILSSSNGITWTTMAQRSPGNRIVLAAAPSNPLVIYAIVESESVVQELIKTIDGGSTWQNLPEPNDADNGINASDFSRGQAWYDLVVDVDPNNENVVLVGAIDLFKSSNGGASWDQISHWYGGYGIQNVHADQHAIVYKPGSSTDVLFGNDGGVYLSGNMNGSNPVIAARNNEYNVTQFYSCAIHPSQENYFLAGAQDNGTQQFQSSGLSSTTDVFGGDGGYCFIDQSDGNFQVCSYVFNYLGISTNNGSGPFNDFSTDQTTGRFINPADYDDRLGILYTAVSNQSMGRYTGIRTGAPTRKDFNARIGTDLASHIRVSPFQTTTTTLFVGTGVGDLFKIEKANEIAPIVTDIGEDLQEGYISCIETGQSEDHLLVTYSSYGVSHILETIDGGTTWAEKDGNLPNMPVRWALFNPTNFNEVILATELGIWRTTDISQESPVWEPSNVGLANVRVDMLQIRESDLEVIAATHGRGLYSSNGFSPTMAPEIPSGLSATPTSPYNVQVQWTDNSINETSFSIERSTNGINFTEIGSVKANNTSYSDATSQPATLYYYRVQSKNNIGDSGYSAIAETTTPIALPDLLVNTFSVRQEGQSLNIQSSFSNNGDSDVADTFGFEVYWSNQKEYSPENAQLLFETTIDQLPRNTSEAISQLIETPFAMTGKTIYFHAILDGKSIIAEKLENNNQFIYSITLILLDADQKQIQDAIVYPNPFDKTLTITLNTHSVLSNYRMVDLSGKTITQNQLVGKETHLEVPQDLKTGIYYLVLSGEGTQSKHRLIKK